MGKKHHLTETGLEKIKEELKELKEKRKKETKEDVPNVLHSEDLNPEFLDFRKKMHLLEKRIIKLEEVIKNAEIIKPPKDKDVVALGAKVTIKADGQEDEFLIVGSLEANPAQGKISNESLVGEKLLGKKKGDEVLISSKVKTVYKIKDINY